MTSQSDIEAKSDILYVRLFSDNSQFGRTAPLYSYYFQLNYSRLITDHRNRNMFVKDFSRQMM